MTDGIALISMTVLSWRALPGQILKSVSRRHTRGDIYSDFEISGKAGLSECGQAVSHDIVVRACGMQGKVIKTECSRGMGSKNVI